MSFNHPYAVKYLPGTRIRLIHMGDDPYPVPDGTKGTVDYVDDMGTIHMRWDNGSSLGLVVGEDEFEVLEPVKITARYADGSAVEKVFDTPKEANAYVLSVSHLIDKNTQVRYSSVCAKGSDDSCK